MLAPHCLDAGGTIDVNDGWDAVLPFRAHLLGPQHERRFVLADENVRCPLIEHDRRKRAKSRLNLTRLFSLSFMSARRGSARMLRLPSARGPNSERPWNQPNTLPSESSFADSRQMLWSRPSKILRLTSSRLPVRCTTPSEYSRPSVACFITKVRGFLCIARWP